LNLTSVLLMHTQGLDFIQDTQQLLLIIKLSDFIISKIYWHFRN